MSNNSSPLIQVSQLSKSFGSKQALNKVNFDINKGQPVALVGPNGAGKTTLFSLLCGYIQPSSGRISILGHHAGSAATFGKLAALPQDAQLDPRFSIAHQLKFYGKLQGFNNKKSQFEAERTLDLVGLKEVLNEKPNALSHGMRKRVTIAQALIGNPEIIMLDEATAGLDPLHAREIRQLVANLSNETTFILSSHDLSELERLCHQVLFLENGVLREHQNVSNESLANNQQTYLTIRMANDEIEFEQSLLAIEQISSVVKTQDREYLITINAPTNAMTNSSTSALPLDIQILQLCHDKKWIYRQIVNGKTLENQLFS
ncbi:MAG: ABC transporter ATP-binding protein [Colwellia sp.]|nr:ABC transporter ATP-binding protein [Colwellia sp.]